jgi:nitrite reductase (cytochrome c-552)
MNKIIGVVAVLVLVLAVLVAVRLTIAKPAPAIKVTPLPSGEYDPAVWGKKYPLEYKSFQQNLDMSRSPTGFGGSIAYQKSEKEPEILVNFKGMPFSKDYAEDRGHPYALEDIKKTKRVTPQTAGSCMTCKTPDLIDIWREMGWGYAKVPVVELFPKLKHSISCANCHDPKTMKLRVINPAFVEAMNRRGIDVSRASQEDMRSYVCGQCHAEYYFEPGTNRVVLPWDKGFDPEQIYAYYAAEPSGFAQDWVHPDSGAKLLKAQHPDFETWQLGVHGRAGVSCADCHMPYKRQSGQKYSSHWVTSPMKQVDASCGTCHEQGSAWLLESVKSTQEKVWQLQRTAGKTIAEAHQVLGAAGAPAGRVDIETARELLRKAQWYWDFVAAENSMGFHNAPQSLNLLGRSVQLSYEAMRTVKRTGK